MPRSSVKGVLITFELSPSHKLCRNSADCGFYALHPAQFFTTCVESGAFRGDDRAVVRAESIPASLAKVNRRLPRLAVFSGRTAAWIHGLDLPPCDPIEVTLPMHSATSHLAGV